MKKILGILIIIIGAFFLFVGLIGLSSSVPIGMFFILLNIAIIYGGIKLSGLAKKNGAANPEKHKDDISRDSIPVDVASCPPVVKCEHHLVTGVAHYLDNIMNLPLDNPTFDCTKRELIDDNLIDERIYRYWYHNTHIDLVEEPTNEYDANAVKVVVDGQHVGYIKKGSCSHIKKLLASGKIKNICCTIQGGDYKYLIELEDDDGNEVYELENTKDNVFYIDLDIYIRE